MKDSTMDYSDNVIDQKHKIAILEVQLDVCEISDVSDISECSKLFYDAVKEDAIDRSTAIEIHYGSCIKDDKIQLTAYLHNTQAECDISYP